MSKADRDGVVSFLTLALAFAWILWVAASGMIQASPLVGGILAVGGGLLILLAGGLLIQHLNRTPRN